MTLSVTIPSYPWSSEEHFVSRDMNKNYSHLKYEHHKKGRLGDDKNRLA